MLAPPGTDCRGGISKSMRRIIVTAFGGPETLKLVEVPMPEPGPSDIRIKVKAAGINFADIQQRLGKYPGGPKPPFGAGFEVAGVVDKIGPRVSDYKPGDEVVAFVDSGFSEYAIADGRFIIRKPSSLTFHQAAALPCQYLTAYHSLFTLGWLQAGQVVLIQAAAGGLGTLLVQLVKAGGGISIGTASTPEKIELVRTLGCDHPVNYQTTDFRAVVKEITGGKGCDLVIESIGGDVFLKSLECVRQRGRLITLGNASRQETMLDAMLLLAKNLTVSGFLLGAYLFDKNAMDKALAKMTELLESEQLKIIAQHAFPLEQAAEAQQFIDDRKSVGKVVLTID